MKPLSTGQAKKTDHSKSVRNSPTEKRRFGQGLKEVWVGRMSQRSREGLEVRGGGDYRETWVADGARRREGDQSVREGRETERRREGEMPGY